MNEINSINIEKCFRFMFALGLLLWAVFQPHLNGIEWLVIFACSFLVLHEILIGSITDGSLKLARFSVRHE